MGEAIDVDPGAGCLADLVHGLRTVAAFHHHGRAGQPVLENHRAKIEKARRSEPSPFRSGQPILPLCSDADLPTNMVEIGICSDLCIQAEGLVDPANGREADRCLALEAADRSEDAEALLIGEPCVG